MDFTDFLQAGIVSVTGKPGAGKSYFSVRVVLQELKKAKPRTIITNVPLNVDALEKRCGFKPKIYTLQTFTDNRFFFTQRGHYQFTVNATDNVDFSEYLQDDDQGVLYIIDEAHLYFNSRNWKDLASATLSYFTFIRHIGDTLLYLTQKYTDVDSQLRGKTQTFNVIRNLARERFLKFFRRGSGFRVYQYINEQDVLKQEKCAQDFTYLFDKKVAKCYSTSLFNKNMDKKTKVRGIPITWLLGLVTVLFVGFIIWLYKYGVLKIVKTGTDKFLKPAIESNIGVKKKPVALGPAEKIKTPTADTGSEFFEFPSQIFPTEPSRVVPATQAKEQKLDEIYSGRSMLSEITVVTQNNSSGRSRSIEFDLVLSEFLDLPYVQISSLGSIKSRDFNAFLKFFDNSSDSISVAKIKCLLKENAPWTFRQGLEIPVARTAATQGVVQTTYEYKQVGFQVNLVFQQIKRNNFLKYEIINSGILDSTGDIATLQNSNISSVVDFLPDRVYQLAEFQDRRQSKSKGRFLKVLPSKDERAEQIVDTKIFISFQGFVPQ